MSERYYLQGKRAEPIDFDGKSFLFDANIWLSINGPYPDTNFDRAKAYTSFYKSALESGCEVAVPQIVAGEFLNRAVRIQADVDDWDRKGKIHRALGYSKWIKEGCDLLNSILDDHCRVADGFDIIELEPSFAVAERGGLEFHDVLIADACRRGGYILVTDDADYSGQTIPIVTWNTKLT